MWQIAEGFSQLGFYPLVYYRKNYQGKEGKFKRLLYTYIEWKRFFDC